MRMIENTEFGKILVRELPLPEGVDPQFTTYTPSGRVACMYKLQDDAPDMIHLMTLEDDGSGICHIYDGPWKSIYRSNGFRYMPFNDNKRAYIGDFILECTPDCDHCEKAEFVPIHYPEALTNLPGLWMVWSENVISPDNETIAWSTLGMINVVYTAKLRREAEAYELDDIRAVSSPAMVIEDPEHPGFVKEPPMRGGEVKQFIRGGKGLSFVGSGKGTGASFLQALDTEEVTALTQLPCYDETTMLSPDERLGVVMSTRFSPKTNCAILGLLPRRGNMLTKGALINIVYHYAVAGARKDVPDANIGPALINLSASMTDPDYYGVDLHDPENRFVYYSPISWHPGSQKAMWNERLKKSLGNEGRVMIAELPDYVPGLLPEIVPVPEKIPYATEGIITAPAFPPAEVKIRGTYAGTAETTIERTAQGQKSTTVFTGFSDDGETFLDGYESVVSPGLTSPGDTSYEADLRMRGTHTGEMKLKLLFHFPVFGAPVTLDPASEGFVRYDGKELRAEDMYFAPEN